MNCINSKQLGENIKNLRKYYGESQEELAYAIGAGEKTAVSNYERGVHMPKRDVIFAIAKHYKITADELINKKFDDLPPIPNKKFGDTEYIEQELTTLFPTIITEEALKQNDFTKAHALQEKIVEQIKQNYIDYSNCEKCLELYKKSAELKCFEGMANFIGNNLLIIFSISLITSKYIYNFDRIKSQTKLANFIKDNILPAVDDAEYENEEYAEIVELTGKYIEKNRIDILVYVAVLKHSKEYSDLGDYYFAWCYRCGLLGTSLTQEMRDSIFSTLISSFAMLGNKYAEKLFS